MKALSVQHLKKVYSNGVVALKGIDLEVEEGDFFALLGQNGAGKSTAIGIISSIVNKTAGKVFVFGHDMDKERKYTKSLISVVPQEMNFSLFDTVGNILINQAGYYGIPAHIAKDCMTTSLKEMNLWDVRDQPAFRLSGGMKRRLMIARALMSNPRLLILDEPTAGVDVELRHTLWQFLKKLNQQGITIILTTHYLEEAEQLCNHVAIIHQGTIIENANMKSMINRSHQQTLILDMDKPLQHNLQLENYEHRQIDDTSLEVNVRKGQSINDLINILSQQHINILSMRNKANRLEELFIHLVSAERANDP